MQGKGIRIVGDGSLGGTRIYNADGKDITSLLQVSKVTITHEAGDVPTAILECLMPIIDVTILNSVSIERIPGRKSKP